MGAQYVVAAPYNVGRIPEGMTLAAGATIGVGGVASAAALFDSLSIPWPQIPSPGTMVRRNPLEKDRKWILIWGASCVTGMMAIQFARISGLRVFAVAGLQNTSELYDLGAEQVVDRHNPTEVIAEAKKLGISLAIDCVGQETATCVVRALQPGGKLVCLVKKPQQLVMEEAQVQVADVLIKRFHEDAVYGQRLVDLLSTALFAKEMRPTKHEIIQGGISGVERGLRALRSQQVSGRKLVVKFE